MDIIKVYNTKLGLFSKGGSSYTRGWTKNGKAWTSIGAFKNHLNLQIPEDKFSISVYDSNKKKIMNEAYFEGVLSKMKYQGASIDDCKVVHFTHTFNADHLIKEIIEKPETYYPQVGSTNTPTHVTWQISPLRVMMLERICHLLQKQIENGRRHNKIFDEARKQQLVEEALRMAGMTLENQTIYEKNLAALEAFHKEMTLRCQKSIRTNTVL